MAALLSAFAQFEREILRERVRAGLSHARQNGQRLGRPQTAALQTSQVRKLYRAGVSKAEIAAGCRSGALRCAESWKQSREETEERPDPGRPHPRPSHRGRLRAGRAGDELVLPSR